MENIVNKGKRGRDTIEEIGENMNQLDKEIKKSIENSDKAVSCMYTEGPKGGMYIKTTKGNKMYLGKKRKPPIRCRLQEPKKEKKK